MLYEPGAYREQFLTFSKLLYGLRRFFNLQLIKLGEDERFAIFLNGPILAFRNVFKSARRLHTREDNFEALFLSYTYSSYLILCTFGTIHQSYESNLFSTPNIQLHTVN